MKINLKEEKENALFSRKEYTFEISYENSTPSRADIAQHAAKLAKTEIDKITVRKIDNTFGLRNAVATVYVYNDAETMKKVEANVREIKLPEPEVKEEPKEEKAEEKPAEEPKAEEKKEEAAKEKETKE